MLKRERFLRDKSIVVFYFSLLVVRLLLSAVLHIISETYDITIQHVRGSAINAYTIVNLVNLPLHKRDGSPAVPMWLAAARDNLIWQFSPKLPNHHINENPRQIFPLYSTSSFSCFKLLSTCSPTWGISHKLRVCCCL